MPNGISSTQDQARSKWAEHWERKTKASTMASEYGDDPVAFWDGYAPKFDETHVNFHNSVMETILRYASPEDRVLDIGAGTGAITLPIARKAGAVTAIEPAAGMLNCLREKMEKEEIGNIEVLPVRWEEAKIEEKGFDLVFSSLVLYFLKDVETGLKKMIEATRRDLLILLSARGQGSPYEKVWSIVKGSPYTPGPDYSCIVSLLKDLGWKPTVKFVDTDGLFKNLDAAVQSVTGRFEASEMEGKGEAILELIQPLLKKQTDGSLLWKQMYRSALINVRV